MKIMQHEFDCLKPFAYLNAEKTVEYRAIMAIFVEAKAHFAIHLRPMEIAEAMNAGQDAIDAAASEWTLRWGGLKKWSRGSSRVRVPNLAVDELFTGKAAWITQNASSLPPPLPLVTDAVSKIYV